MATNNEILAAIQTLAERVGMTDARVTTIESDVKSLIETLHLGDGAQESFGVRLARVEDTAKTNKERFEAVEAENKKLWRVLVGALALGGVGGADAVAKLFGMLS